MTHDDIIRMAREVFDVETDSRGRETFSGDNYGVERFATLVAAAEGLACEEIVSLCCGSCAEAIRARREPIRARGLE